MRLWERRQTRVLGIRALLQMSQVCGVQGSGFSVQDLRVYVELQVLNAEPRTLTTGRSPRSEALPR